MSIISRIFTHLVIVATVFLAVRLFGERIKDMFSFRKQAETEEEHLQALKQFIEEFDLSQYEDDFLSFYNRDRDYVELYDISEDVNMHGDEDL